MKFNFYIVTPINTSRLQYVCNWLFIEQLNANFTITKNLPQLQNNDIVIHYTNHYFSQELFLNPNSIISENTIDNNLDVKIKQCKEYSQLFCDESTFGFDFFSMIFFLLSRYEEYWPTQFDKFERYDFKNSIAFKYGFIDYPILDFQLKKFIVYIQTIYPNFTTELSIAKLNITYDIDEAFFSKGHSWIKNIFRKIRYSQFGMPDIYDTYDKILEYHKKYDMPQINFFFLVADNNFYNRNVSHKSRAFKKLIDKYKSQVILGLHPGYYTANNHNTLNTELNRLEKIANTKIDKCRMHYLKNKLPETYHNLLQLDITEDHSMAYASINGFRASTANNFYWYDLVNETETNLKIVPYSLMEGTFAEDLNLDSYQAIEKITSILTYNKRNNINTNIIWHNHTISNFGFWQKWISVYDSIFTTWYE